MTKKQRDVVLRLGLRTFEDVVEELVRCGCELARYGKLAELLELAAREEIADNSHFLLALKDVKRILKGINKDISVLKSLEITDFSNS